MRKYFTKININKSKYKLFLICGFIPLVFLLCVGAVFTKAPTTLLSGPANMVWKTDSNGVPDWRESTSDGAESSGTVHAPDGATTANRIVVFKDGSGTNITQSAFLVGDFQPTNTALTALAANPAMYQETNAALTALAADPAMYQKTNSNLTLWQEISPSAKQDVDLGLTNMYFGYSDYNTILGTNSSRSGTYNTAVGHMALNLNNASGNSGFGYMALGKTTSGAKNVAVGYFANGNAASGDENTAIGYEALKVNTGAYNTAVGSSALIVSTGAGNTAVGYRALYGNTYSQYNTAVGYQALFSNVIGYQNVAIGYGAGYFETTTDNLWVDNRTRASRDDALEKALIYGKFADASSDQYLYINGALRVTGEAYVTGNIRYTLPTVAAYSEVTNFVADISRSYLSITAVDDVHFIHSTNRPAIVTNVANVIVRVIADGTDVVITKNASWKSFGSTTWPITITNGNWGVISITCFGTAETDVGAAATYGY